MAQPTSINLSDTSPAAPPGRSNVNWLAGPPYPDPNNPQVPVRDVSANMPPMAGDTGSGGASGAVPAPASGDAAAGKFLKADATWAVPPGGGGGGTGSMVVGYDIASGAAGTNVGPMLTAPAAGSVSKCVVVTKASDSSVGLTFTIKKNGTSVFSASPTVAAGTASGTVSTFTGLTTVPLSVAANDVFTCDITGGNANWQFTAQLET